MKLGLLKIIFRFNILVLLLFFYRNALYWLNTITYKQTISDPLINLSILALVLIGIIIIVGNIKYIVFKGIHLIAFLWIVGMFFVFLYNIGNWLMFLRCILWPILFESTYIYTLRIKRVDYILYRFYHIVVVIGIIIFFESMIFYSFGDSSNMIYFIILTTPFLLQTNNRNYLLFLLICVTILSILSSKRSIILAMGLFWIIIGIINCIQKKQVFLTLVLGIIISITSVYSFQYIDKINGSISSRMESDDITSGRNAIYEMTWLMIVNSPSENIIIGHGHDTVRQHSLLRISAHNEWLEILYDYGVLMLILYLCLWIYMIKKWIYLYKSQSRYLTSYTMCLCIWAVMSMVSQLVVYVSYVLYLFMFLAFVEAKTSQYKLYNKLH